MLSCTDTKNLLSAYYDGELGVAASQQVAEHLGSCKECQKELEDMKRISKAFTLLDGPKADEKFVLALREKLADNAKPAGSKKLNLILKKVQPYIAIAACVVLMIGVYEAVDNSYTSQNISAPAPVELDLQSDKTQKQIVSENDILPSEEAPKVKSVKQTIKKLNPSGMQEEDIDDLSVQNDDIEKQETTLLQTSESKDESDKTNNEPHAIENNEKMIMGADNNSEETPENDRKTNDNSEGKKSDDENEASATYKQKFIKTTFILNNKNQLENVVDILKKYGDVQIFENYIDLKILCANYDACIKTLSGMDSIELKNTEDIKDVNYCSIRLEF